MIKYLGILSCYVNEKTLICEGVNVKKQTDKTDQISVQDAALQEKKKKIRRARRLRRHRFWDRVAGFIIVSVLLFGCTALGLEYILLKGPSPALRDIFINTMDETRRFRFVPRIILSEEELKEIKANEKKLEGGVSTDASLITISAKENPDDHTDGYGLVDEDGDGIIFLEVKGNGFMGYMTVILDPTRVFVGMPDNYGGIGLTLEQMVQKYDAIGGINGGGFRDDGGAGLGGEPEGLTIVNGVCYNPSAFSTEGFAGLDKDGILHVGFYTYDECVELGIVNAVSFGPILITNGEPTPPEFLTSSVNPRTAIAQRADGAILMLVIDWRQVHSIGATYQDVVDLLLDYGAVNACNMDGGSSTVMYYQGRYVNSCSAENGQPRPLPDAFLFK